MFRHIQGTRFVYETLLRPFVMKHEKDMDSNLQELRSRMWDSAIYCYHNCSELGQTMFFEVTEHLASKQGKFDKAGSEVCIVFGSMLVFKARCLLCILKRSFSFSQHRIDYFQIANCRSVRGTDLNQVSHLDFRLFFHSAGGLEEAKIEAFECSIRTTCIC